MTEVVEPEAYLLSIFDNSCFYRGRTKILLHEDASLWSADDTFASALMERFYQRLALGEETSSALRGAKLDLVTKYGEQVSPFYWAGFVAIGDASTPIRIRE